MTVSSCHPAAEPGPGPRDYGERAPPICSVGAGAVATGVRDDSDADGDRAPPGAARARRNLNFSLQPQA